MRPIVVTEFISLDGIVEDPGGSGQHPRGGWTFKDVEFDEAAYELKGREQDEAGAMLMGRRTYEEFAPVWPSMTDEFPRYNAMPRYVVSSTLTDTSAWEATVMRSLDEVAELRSGEGGPIILHGSPTLAKGLAAAGLVDRYHLLVFPVLLGSGLRLFGDGGTDGRLTLTEHATYGNGIRMAVYEVEH